MKPIERDKRIKTVTSATVSKVGVFIRRGPSVDVGIWKVVTQSIRPSLERRRRAKSAQGCPQAIRWAFQAVHLRKLQAMPCNAPVFLDLFECRPCGGVVVFGSFDYLHAMRGGSER